MRVFIITTSIIILIQISCSSKQIVADTLPCSHEYNFELKSNVYTFVNEMPEYIGGDLEFLKYIYNTLEFPQDKFNPSSFLLEFIIGIDGKLIPQRINNKKFEEMTDLEKKIYFLLSKSKKWRVGKCIKSKVPVKMYFTFKL